MTDQNGGTADTPYRAVHADASAVNRRGQATMTRAFLFNPGLINGWFGVTGVLGLLPILNGSIVASAAMVKEREAGTIEELVMSPVETAEIIVAKIAALFLLLMLMVIFAAGCMKLVFDVPFHGNFLVVFCGASLCHPLRHRTGYSDCDVFRSRHSRHSSPDILSIRCSLQLRARSRRGKRFRTGCNRWCGSIRFAISA